MSDNGCSRFGSLVGLAGCLVSAGRLAFDILSRPFSRRCRVANRIRNFTVSTTSIAVAPASPERDSITFVVGNSAGSGSVMVLDGGLDATVALGIPVSQVGGPVTLTGLAARRAFTAIRLVAADTVLAVIEGFPDNYAEHEPDAGVPA